MAQVLQILFTFFLAFMASHYTLSTLLSFKDSDVLKLACGIFAVLVVIFGITL